MNNSSRIQAIQPFHVMALLARAKELEAEGKNIVHMEIGEPDFPTPAPVIEAAMAAMSRGNIHYTPAVGLPELREAIAGFYQTRYGIQLASRRVVVTPGASGALMLALGVIMQEGNEVLLADPGYPCNRNFVRFLSGKARPISVNASSAYQLTLKHIKENWQENSVAAIVASPSNPTGTLISKTELAEMAEYIKEQRGYFIVDEIYHGLVYEGDVDTALTLNDNIIVINSFSKYFNMTGWRVGWMIVPDELLENIDKLAQNIFLATSTPAQYAALAAFKPETQVILESNKNEFKQRRDYLLPALENMGFKIEVKPQGAFYIYANCEIFTRNSYKFCYDLLEHAGVAITPGKDFGDNMADTFVRFAYTISMSRLKEGVKRLNKFINNAKD